MPFTRSVGWDGKIERSILKRSTSPSGPCTKLRRSAPRSRTLDRQRIGRRRPARCQARRRTAALRNSNDRHGGCSCQRALEYIRYPIAVDASAFRKATGFTHAIDEKTARRSHREAFPRPSSASWIAAVLPRTM